MFCWKINVKTIAKITPHERAITGLTFKNARIIVTGDGRVAKGSLEFLQSTNIRKISPSEFLRNNNNSSSVFCNLTTSDYVINKDKTNFNLKDFIDFPQKYISLLYKYLPSANIKFRIRISHWNW